MALNQAQLVNPPVGTRPGGVKAGSGITISADGTISASAGGTAGQGLVLDGTAIKVSITTAATPPAAGASVSGAVAGSLYWDNNLGELYIYYSDGFSTQWVQTNAGSLNIANLPALP